MDDLLGNNEPGTTQLGMQLGYHKQFIHRLAEVWAGLQDEFSGIHILQCII